MIWESISYWVLAIFYVMAATELVVESEIFFKVRVFFSKLPVFGNFFTKLLGCGYCTSVWVAFTVGWCLPGSIIQNDTFFLANVLIRSLALHRMSNLVHKLYRQEWHFVVHHVDDVAFEPDATGAEDGNDTTGQ